ncbi:MULTISPECIES: leucine-rich repeat domain-containing protein [Eubacterium]|uniref:leucine-rich repeat domain-containing protein n=1 Tax=Eubacterium TaxID=1730 RepID=UPI000E557506|nr:leucine-rich repeat domain-containing protein [Eubacterium sp. AF34-35BH]RHP21246.1 leucine-rich repeat domain-containing protein [Eubacterium sp. AF34-35BH]
MRKSKFLSVLTATTLALTLAVPTVMPLELTTGVVKAVEVTTTAPSQKIEGRCGDNAIYSYDKATRTLTISGTGAMWNGTKYSYLGTVDKIVIGNGITVIGEDAFAKFNGVGSVEISDTVTTIKGNAFNDLKSITIPKTVRTVETDAFYGVGKVVVEGDMNNFQYGALGYGVQEVQLKGSAETLGLALAEVQDRDYLSVTITKDNNRCRIANGCLVSSDGKTVYYHISDSNKVTIPDTAVTIKSAAFYNQGIEEVKLGKNVKTIEPYAFAENPVSKLTTNSKLKKIGRCAFMGTDLKKVTLKSSVAMSPKAFNQKVILTSTKSLKSAKTVMTSATFKKNKINAKFAKLTGAKGYQVQIKKGGKTYKYFTTKTSIKVKAPKVFKKKYNVSFSYDIDNYTSKIEGKPAYISVRPYKIVKKNKKSYGKWSEKIVLTK